MPRRDWQVVMPQKEFKTLIHDKRLAALLRLARLANALTVGRWALLAPLTGKAHGFGANASQRSFPPALCSTRV